jgi:hypothetical protein
MNGTIAMSTTELTQVEVFERLQRREITQKSAAAVLRLSVRQVKRKLRAYKLEGAPSLVHGSRGKVSNRKVAQGKLDSALDTIREHYLDFAPTLAHEKLVEEHGCTLSLTTIRQAMIKEGIWQPSRRRKAQVHQLRDRRACFGELVQLDGSPHDWFEGRAEYCNLNVSIDDAQGTVLLQFSLTETTQDYFKLLEHYIHTYGLPRALYVDKHSIFRVNTPANLALKKPQASSPHEGLTQLGRAMQELGIALIFASTAQAKGRVERVNQTLQDRLVKELRLQNISSIEEANLFLAAGKFTEKFNQKFKVPPQSTVDMHRQLPSSIDLQKVLCIKEHRVLSKNLTLQYNATIFQIQTKRSAYTLRKTTVTICERFDGSITIWDNKDHQLAYTTLKKLPSTRVTDSKNLNHAVNAILSKENYTKKNPWESDFEELEQQNLFFKAVRAV